MFDMGIKKYGDPTDGKTKFVDSNGTQWVYDDVNDRWDPAINRKPYKDENGRWHYFDNESEEWKTEIGEDDVDAIAEVNKQLLGNKVKYTEDHPVKSFDDKTANVISKGYNDFTNSNIGKIYQGVSYGLTMAPIPQAKVVGGAMQIPLIVAACGDMYTNGVNLNNALDIVGGATGLGGEQQLQNLTGYQTNGEVNYEKPLPKLKFDNNNYDGDEFKYYFDKYKSYYQDEDGFNDEPKNIDVLSKEEMDNMLLDYPELANDYVLSADGRYYNQNQVMTPFDGDYYDDDDAYFNDKYVIRGYPTGTKNGLKDKIKRTAEVIMRLGPGENRSWSYMPKILNKYSQYIKTGSGSVPNEYQPIYDPDADGSDLIDLQLYNNIDPSYGLVEDGDIAFYGNYLNKAYPGKKVRSFTYKPTQESYKRGIEKVSGDVTPIGHYNNEDGIPGIDTAHDYIEYGKDKDGNIVVRGTDVIDYYPGDYTNLWSKRGGKAKAFIQSSLLNSVTNPVVVKGEWRRPSYEDRDFINEEYIPMNPKDYYNLMLYDGDGINDDIDR